MKLVPTLGFDDADALMRAALDAARARGISVTVAIVDRAGQMLALARMDGARGHSVGLAERKARTAASTGYPTVVLAQVLAGQPLGAEVLAVPGGVPVVVDGETAGAIGVSGAMTEDDEAVAAAGLAALETA